MVEFEIHLKPSSLGILSFPQIQCNRLEDGVGSIFRVEVQQKIQHFHPHTVDRNLVAHCDPEKLIFICMHDSERTWSLVNT